MRLNIKNKTTKTVFAKLIQPIIGLIQQSSHKRQCKRLSDQLWFEMGLQKVFCQESSGRAFLQKLIDKGKCIIFPSLFFEALKSKRRLRLCQEVSHGLYDKVKSEHKQNDFFSRFKILDGYDIYAGDGHYHSAAAHDVKKDGKKYGTQHFYSTDLRSQALRHLTLADTSGNRKKEHDIRALKRQDIATLRQGAPKGRKVLYVWDKACIDFMQWYKWKQKGIYFVSREKKNMDLMVIGKLDYDKNDPMNAGVIDCELVGCHAGISMRRIVFQCPITRTTYSYITNDMNIPPGLIAYIYKTRWDIEKKFDEVKNKFGEKKAWATSETAKTMQALFICMAYNLMLLFEEYIEEQGIKNNKEDKRRKKRLSEDLSKCELGKDKLPFFLTTAKRATQRSQKFIRWLRNHLFSDTSWLEAVMFLKLIYDYF